MPPKARVVSVPQARATELGPGATMRLISGSMGAPNVDAAAPAAVPLAKGDGRFESGAPDDDAWQKTLADRERAEGLAQERQVNPPVVMPSSSVAPVGLPDAEAAYRAAFRAQPDLTGLPDRFALEIEQKGGAWIIRAPDVHIGLFVAHLDLPAALADAPAALASILRLDGPVPQSKRRRKS